MTGPGLRGPVLVTGTDTGVGKTVVTAAIAAAAGAAGLRVAVVKPAQTGGDSDAETVVWLAAPAAAVTLASYPDPLAPLVAAAEAGLPPLAFDAAQQQILTQVARHDLVLVEGAGGLLVPMGLRATGAAWTVANLAVALGAPAVVVTRAGLGTLNHTALTSEALRHRAVPTYLVIGAWPARPERVHLTNREQLQPYLAGAVPDGAGGWDPEAFRRAAPSWLSPALHGKAVGG